MLRFLISLFIILHGLVHLWYFTLSHGLVEFKPEMGWTGRSWILSGFLGDTIVRSVASTLFVVAAIAFMISGVGTLLRAEWWRTILLGSAILYFMILFLFWDGSMQMVIQKGLIGFLISLAILLMVPLFKQSFVVS